MSDPSELEHMSAAERALLTLEVLRELRELREELATFLEDLTARVAALEKRA